MRLPLISRRMLLAGAAALTLASCASMQNEDAGPVLQRANAAMGGAAVNTIRVAGSGTGATFGQAYQPGMVWPRIAYSSFVRVYDYPNAAMREDAARSRTEPTGGGAVPLMGTGEQRTTGFVRGADAWNGTGATVQAAGVAVDQRIHDLWTSPHGVLRAAMKNKAVVAYKDDGGRPMTGVSFTEPGRFEATAWINADGLVERVDARVPNPVMGDMAVTTWYSDYKDWGGGVKFPARIRQTQGGFPVLDLDVKEVRANVATEDLAVPASIAGAVERVTVEKAAEGVWFIAGGSHNSVAIEMKDHFILVEAPLYDGRSQPVIAEVKKLAGTKPIRYVINSHHHFDHAGGLRTAIAEGYTLVTSDAARQYYEATFANPNSIHPDAMQKSGKKAVITTVNGKRVFTDGTRNVEVHYIEDSVHAQGFMMVWLPAEKILIEADAYTPGAPKAPTPNPLNANNVNLSQNIDRLKMDVRKILPLHGRMVSVEELNTAVGKK